MSDFGEEIVRKTLALDGIKTQRYHALSKMKDTVSYDFYIIDWNCLGEVKTKFNASKTGFSIPKKTLVKYKKYSELWGYEYIFYFVDINSKAIYSISYDDFKKEGKGVHNHNLSSVKFYPNSEHYIGDISPQDYRDFTLNYSKKTVKSYEF